MKTIYIWVKWFMLALMIVVGAYFYDKLPDQIPVHWNYAGEIDAYGPKTTHLFMIPAITLVMMILFVLLPKLDPKKDRYEKFADIYEIIQLAILGFMVYMYFITIAAALNPLVDVTFYVLFGVGVMFVLMGNYMGKIRQNYFVGIKTPWTLDNEEVWNKTHRLGGWCFVFSGLIFVLQAFTGVVDWWLFVTAILISVAVPIGYSYWLYKKIKK